MGSLCALYTLILFGQKTTQPTKINLIQNIVGTSYTDKKVQPVRGSIDYGLLDLTHQDLLTEQTFLEILNEKNKIGLPLVVLITKSSVHDEPIFKAYEGYGYLIDRFKQAQSSFRQFLFENKPLPPLNFFKDIESGLSLSKYPIIFCIWSQHDQAEYVGELEAHKKELVLYMPYYNQQMVTDKINFMHSELDHYIKKMNATFQDSVAPILLIRAAHILAKMPDALWMNPAGMHKLVLKFLTLFLSVANILEFSQVKHIYRLIHNDLIKKMNFDAAIREDLALLLSTQPDLVKEALKQLDTWYTMYNDKQLLLVKAKILIQMGDMEQAEKILEDSFIRSMYPNEVMIWQAFINAKKGIDFPKAKQLFDSIISQPIDWENPSRAELNIYFDAFLNKAEALLDRKYKTKVQQLLQELKNTNQLQWMSAYQVYRAKKLWKNIQKKESNVHT